jgi:hypothetical protein
LFCVGTEKKSAVCPIFLKARVDASLIPCHHTALALHLFIPSLTLVVSKGRSSIETSPHRRLGYLLQISQLPHHRSPPPPPPPPPPRQHHTPSLRSQHQPRKLPFASCDAFPDARLKCLGSDLPPARPPPTSCLRVKRPHDPLLGARAPRRRSPSLSLPSAAPCLPLWAKTTTQTASQRTRPMHLLCPASPAPLRRGSGHARWVVELGRHSGWRARRSQFRGGRRYRAWIRWQQQLGTRSGQWRGWVWRRSRKRERAHG